MKNHYLNIFDHSSSSSSPSPSAAGSGSGGYIGLTSKFLRNLPCLSMVPLLFKVLFFAFTLKPWIHRLCGRIILLSRAAVTRSLCSSASNGSYSSVRCKLSNSIGPKTKGRSILAFKAFSKLAGTNKSKFSSADVIIGWLLSSAGSSSAFPLPFLALALAFLAASIACSFLSSSDFLSVLLASSSYFFWSLYSLKPLE